MNVCNGNLYWRLLLLLTILEVALSSCIYLGLSDYPQSTTYINFGEHQSFNCSGRGSRLYWYVDGENMTNEALNQRGITLSGSNSPHYGNCELQSYMTITGNCFNNNTKIYCVILGSNSDTGTRNVTSPIANIIVSVSDAQPSIKGLSMMVNDKISILWDIVIPDYVLTLTVAGANIDSANVTGLNHYDVALTNLEPCLWYRALLSISKLDGTGISTRSVSTRLPPVLSANPTTTTIEIGHSATFHCSGHGTYLYWYIDGINSNDITEGISFSTSGNYNNNPRYARCASQDSYMTIVGDCGNNNTEIYCVIVGYSSDSNVTSNTVYLVVQGTAPMIHNLRSKTNIDHLVISWTIFVPYDTYTLQLNISNGDGYSLYNVYGLTTYELHQPNPCTTYHISLTLQLNVSCSAVENVASNFISDVSFEPYYIAATINYAQLFVTFKANDVHYDCLLPDELELLLWTIYPTVMQTSIIIPWGNVSATEHNYMFQIPVNVKDNDIYHMSLVTYNVNGRKSTIPHIISTYDVQGASYTVEDSKVCITCKYRDTTNAKGCIAVLVPSSIDDSTIQLNILMNNSQCTALSSNTTLLVYDWEVDGGRSTWPAAREEIYISRLEQPLIIQDIPLKLLVTSIKYEQSTSLLQFNLLFHQTDQNHDICILPYCPDTLDVKLWSGDKVVQETTIPWDNISDVGGDSYSLSIMTSSIVDNEVYQVILVTRNALGTSISNPYQLSTFDIQNVSYTIEGSKVCITCNYRDTANAKGCIAALVPSSVNGSTLQLNIPRKFNINDTQCTVLSDNATLLVYDWEINGERSTRPATVEDIIIDSVHMSTSSMSIMPSSIGSASLPLSETGTVLLSLFCVALCILTAVTLIIVFVVVMQRRKNSHQTTNNDSNELFNRDIVRLGKNAAYNDVTINRSQDTVLAGINADQDKEESKKDDDVTFFLKHVQLAAKTS